MKALNFIFLLLFAIVVRGWSQETVKGDYSILKITQPEVIISGVVTIKDSLVISPGTTVLFSENASLICQGALVAVGTANSRIHFKSVSGNIGKGLVIDKVSNKEIQVQYANFTELLLPLSFTYGWMRPTVILANNQFYYNKGMTAVVLVDRSQSLNNDSIVQGKFSIIRNLFSENSAPVYFEDFSNDQIQVEIVENSFIANRLIDFGRYSFSNNVLFGRFDKGTTGSHVLRIEANSFLHNYLQDAETDTILQVANFGIYGSADSFTIAKNFWGDTSNAEYGIYDYYLDRNSPRTNKFPVLTTPEATLPTHVYLAKKIPLVELEKSDYKMRDGVWQKVGEAEQSKATSILRDFKTQEGLQALKLFANKKLVVKHAVTRFFYLTDSSEVKDTIVSARIDSSGGNNVTFVFNYKTDSLFRNKTGYLQISGMESIQGEHVPDIRIGHEFFLTEKFKKRITRNQFVVNNAPVTVDKSIVKDKTFSKFSKRYELGFVSGFAIYYGTISEKNLLQNDINSALGIRFRYDLQKHLSANITVSKFILSGSDLKSADSSKKTRGISFKTPVMMISSGLSYDLLDNFLFSKNTKLRPSFGFGVDYIKFNPMGEYQGKWYQLQPLGTGGQLLTGNASPSGIQAAPYKLSTIGAKISAELRYHINMRSVISFYGSYHLAFSNYLDDVGPDYYPDRSQIMGSNVNDPEAASYFSNPSNRFITNKMLRSNFSDGGDGFFQFGFIIARHF